MLIVGLGHPTQEGTATACASTSVLMSAVFLVYVQQLKGWLLKYIGVAVGSSMVGAYVGCVSSQAICRVYVLSGPVLTDCFRFQAFASRLSPVSINFFVGGMLAMCAVLAVVPVRFDFTFSLTFCSRFAISERVSTFERTFEHTLSRRFELTFSVNVADRSSGVLR